MSEELILKDKRSSIEFAWSGDDLAIDAENSNERVLVFLDSAQAQELFEYLKRKYERTMPECGCL